MKNNDLIGKVVLSEAGRDKDHFYVCIDTKDENYLILSNGSTKTVQFPKKKKLKHLKVLEYVNDDLKEFISSKHKSTDLKIKRFLKLRGIVKEG